MTATIRDLMLANLFDVFNERDRERRTTAIARTYTDTVVFSDLDGITTGREALNEKAQKLLEKAPDFVFTAAGPVYETHDLGYLAWHKGPKEQPPVVSGMDIAIIREGRIAALYTLLTTSWEVGLAGSVGVFVRPSQANAAYVKRPVSPRLRPPHS